MNYVLEKAMVCRFEKETELTLYGLGNSPKV